MTFIGLIIVLIAIGVALNFIPMDPRIKTIVIALIAIVVLILVLSAVGLLGPVGSLRLR